jgi:hypothetical protein
MPPIRLSLLLGDFYILSKNILRIFLWTLIYSILPNLDMSRPELFSYIDWGLGQYLMPTNKKSQINRIKLL